MHRHAFEAVDHTIRDIMKIIDESYESKPFGNKILILGGDFRQVLPNVKNGTESEIVNSYVNNSDLCSYFKNLRLTINMRLNTLSNDSSAKDFSEYLLRVGECKETYFVDDGGSTDYKKVANDLVVNVDEKKL